MLSLGEHTAEDRGVEGPNPSRPIIFSSFRLVVRSQERFISPKHPILKETSFFIVTLSEA